jgi:hypothetical protein
MRNVPATVVFVLLLALCGCSTNGSSGAIQTVSAQTTTYTNSSVSGTYVLEMPDFQSDATGQITADGNGNLSGGSLNYYVETGITAPFTWTSCTQSISGTYNIQSNGNGTLSMALTAPTPAPPCANAGLLGTLTNGPYNMTLHAAQQGAVLVAGGFGTTTGSNPYGASAFTFSAYKQ